MAVHYFHCTDGVDLVLDRTGQDIRTKREIHRRACAAAGRLMSAVPPGLDWSNWIVSVHDWHGSQIETVPFPEAAPRRAA
jgi:hypothetical protein